MQPTSTDSRNRNASDGQVGLPDRILPDHIVSDRILPDHILPNHAVTERVNPAKDISGISNQVRRLVFRAHDKIALSASESRALISVVAFLLVGMLIQEYRLRSLPPLLPPLEVQPQSEESAESAPPESSGMNAVSSEREADGRIDLNRASSIDLQRLPGIGPAIAARIVEFRSDFGGFDSVDELTAVRGIGRKTVEKLRQFATVGARHPFESNKSSSGPASGEPLLLDSPSSTDGSDGISTHSLLTSSSRSKNR